MKWFNVDYEKEKQQCKLNHTYGLVSAGLEKYIKENYVETPDNAEPASETMRAETQSQKFLRANGNVKDTSARPPKLFGSPAGKSVSAAGSNACAPAQAKKTADFSEMICDYAEPYADFSSEHESKLQERLKHVSDTFSEYLMYMIREKHMNNAEVWKRAIVDKKVFSKIKNNPDYHPNKLTALCLCVGARLNIDEARDLLARAGYTFSPCDLTDIIFSYFIENEIYDMIELDIQLEEHGLPCIIA